MHTYSVLSDASVTYITAAFIVVLSNISSQCADLAKVFPKSLYMANVILQAGSTLFVMFFVKSASTFICFKIVSRG